MSLSSRALLALASCALLWSCASPIVGAECRKGLTACAGRCVDVLSDNENCGLCGRDCGAGECNAGSCGPGARSDGGFSRDDAGIITNGVPTTSGGVGRPFPSDGGLTFPDPNVELSCSLGESACSDSCSNLRDDPGHCGGCSNPCPSGQFCVEGECKDLCEPPFMACAGGCSNGMEAADHCGKCGVICASGLCESGVCADVIPGQVVVIGHDYLRGTIPATMQRLAGDALFLANGAPVRTLIYRGSAAESSVARVVAAFDSVAAQSGRQWEAIDADPDAVPEQLRDANAFVIHAQSDASDDELIELGRRWGRALTQFLLRGGVVVLFETTSTSNSGTYQLLEPSGLFTADSRKVIANSTLDVVGSGFGAAAHATRRYLCTTSTVHFVGVTSPGNILVEDKDGLPVVVQRIVTQ